MSNYPSESCITLCFHSTAWALIFQSPIFKLEETFGIFQLSHWTLANCMVRNCIPLLFWLAFILLLITFNIFSCFLVIFLFLFLSNLYLFVPYVYFMVVFYWIFVFFPYFDFLTVHKLGKRALCQLSSIYFSILFIILDYYLFTGILLHSVKFPFLASGQRSLKLRNLNNWESSRKLEGVH